MRDSFGRSPIIEGCSSWHGNQQATSTLFGRQPCLLHAAYFPERISMRGYFCSLRVLIPAGVVSHGSLARKAHAKQQSREGDTNREQPAHLESSLGTQLAKQLEGVAFCVMQWATSALRTIMS